ncbi:uncharacterized protein K452DRAFT_308557 [Aplosporella prunicola CBS 121167]|uniref:Uncharacterized protein n=1 Tax=Aplosporella prunicola CBS 121167 TaxID=1176127 RepID=A0A6A6BI08_9PEZI|nr:uncharacterized protein K452DRAFT_308557 [Aplosporella prunicola CBS 121167]KAF2142181.1 hypothetical protein K452DRAFT_308557 [Aplosporella prunicola CBS 121167]
MVSYGTSKVDNLSDADKLRIISAYLNHNEPQNVYWTSAATQAGSASKESYKKMLNTSLQKLRATEGDKGADGNETAPKPQPKKGGRKKREATDDGGEQEGNPTKKARKSAKPRAKKAAVTTKKPDTDGEEAETAAVKPEASDDEDA